MSRSGATSARDDPATLAAVGVLAATLASVAHETLGHGGACLAGGGEVTLLTSIFFRCRGATLLTDVAGPLAGLALGAGAMGALWGAPRLGQAARLFLLNCAAVALLWGFGQMARDALQGVDDWRQAAAVPGWRWPLVAVGVGGYVGTMRLARLAALRLTAASGRETLRRLLLPFAAGAVAMALAGVLWAKDPLGSACEELLTLAVAPLGYVWVAISASRTPSPEPGPSIARAWGWIGAAVAIFAAFALIQGRGLGPLS